MKSRWGSSRLNFRSPALLLWRLERRRHFRLRSFWRICLFGVIPPPSTRYFQVRRRFPPAVFPRIRYCLRCVRISLRTLRSPFVSRQRMMLRRLPLPRIFPLPLRVRFPLRLKVLSLRQERLMPVSALHGTPLRTRPAIPCTAVRRQMSATRSSLQIPR